MHILHNAKIYTLWDEHPTASAIAINDGKITAVGSLDDLHSLATRTTKMVDLQGGTVWPGLTDSHIHLQMYALGLKFVDCETSSRGECIQRVAKKVLQSPAGIWVQGHGWNQNDWPEGFGNSALLDGISPDNPVYLTAKSLHAGWANSAALRMAGITQTTPDPADGIIQRDASGNPTGILFESAMGLLESAIPAPSQDQITDAIEQAQPVLWSVGLTGVHDFDRRSCFHALQTLESTGNLKLRVLKSIPLEDLEHAVAIGLQTGFGSEFLRIGSVKLFADGALGPQTAAMIQPYENEPDNFGLLFLDAEQIVEHGQLAAQSGLSLAVHAIGDRANHEVLKAYAQLRQLETIESRPHLLHRIEHVQVLHPDHLQQLADLNIVASMQPIHTTSDMDTADRHWGSRARYAYAFKTLRGRGTRLIFGSDAPVESPNPFWGLHAAVTRQRHSGYPSADGWNPQERLVLQEALESYTIHPAFVAGWGDRLGRLAPGYNADLIVLPINPFQIDPSTLHIIKPERVMFAGEWVIGG